MAATVREFDENEPSKNEPLNSESAKSEPSKSEPFENEPLKRESLRSEPSKDGSLNRESLNRQSSKGEPSKNQLSKDKPKNVDDGPSGRATEAPEPPWKGKARRGVFEGDVAVVELRSRLALASERILEPVAPNPTVPTGAALLRLTGGVLMAVAVAGVTGYLLGFRLSTKSPAPVDARGAAHDVTSVDAVQQLLPLATAPPPLLPSRPFPPPAPAEDASEFASDIMANGQIFREFMVWREQQLRKQ